jgi:hypothetical protein
MRLKALDPKIMLSTLWIFVTVNYIFCDVFTLMYPAELQKILSGNVEVEMTQQFLLMFAFIMEIPMLMIVLSRILNYRANRLINLIAAAIMTLVQAGSLTVGSNTMHYIFFSIVEISATLLIIWYSWNWKDTK